MNIQRFVLPATIAAAFHAVLLCAFTPDEISVIAIKLPPARNEKPEKPAEPIELPPPEDDVVQEVKPMPKGAPRPESEEMFRELRDTPFVVEPLREAARRVIDTGKIEPLGVPEGIGSDIVDRDINRHLISSKFLDKEPRAKVQMAPDYPPTMKKDGHEGTVMVEFDVDVKGRVVSARVRESTARAFEEPTIRAVLKWRFEPGLSQGRPVPFRMVIPVNFTLGAD